MGFHTIYRTFAFTLFISLLSACADQKTDISNTGGSQGLKYSVLSKTEALADGFTDLTVDVLVEDLLGHVMANYIPPTALIGDSGINYISCTPSNPSGISQCTFRSQLEGKKTVKFGSATAATITFNPVTIKNAGQFGVISSMQINGETSDGSFVSTSIGNIVDHPKQRSSTWIVYTDPAVRQ
jgi:hypothetical protein